MLVNQCKTLTDKEADLITRIAGDVQSGNYLIRSRDDEYWSMWNLMVVARKAVELGTADKRQREMVEYEKQSSDYFYWRNLPESEKLFIEVEEDEQF
jgi:hypothetical protein